MNLLGDDQAWFDRQNVEVAEGLEVVPVVVTVSGELRVKSAY